MRLQVSPFFASEMLVPRLSSFSALYDDIDLQIESDIAPNRSHSADMDVSIVVGAGGWADLQATRLFPQSYVAACSPALKRRIRIRRPLDLVEQPLIVHRYRPDLWERWAAMLGAPALRPKQLIEFDSMASIVHAAEQGVGIALVSAPLAAGRFAAGSLRRVFDRELATGDSYYMLAQAEDAERPAVRALIGWLLQQYGGSSRWLDVPQPSLDVA